MKLFINLDRIVHGGPQVWCQRFQDILMRRGFTVTSDLRDEWDAALFVNRSEGLEYALSRGKLVVYRVANGYLPHWFQVMKRSMEAEHHTANANIARALENSNFVIYQTQWAKDELDTFLYPRTEQFAIVPNGVSLSLFHPPAHLPTDIPVIGLVGVLRYRYRMETFIEMSRRLAIPHRLLVVGSIDAECADVLHRAQSDPTLGPHITYQEAVPPEQLPIYYQQMNLLVHPVCGDVCPNVVVEAQACGVPVVAPRYGGTSELVGKAGVIFDCQPWVYDDNFINAMTAATRQALSNTQYLSNLARINALAQFDLQIMTDRYLQALGLPLSSLQSQTKPVRPISIKPTLRQRAAPVIARPRYYAAITLRKARQAQRKYFPPRPNPRPRIAFTLFDFHVGGIENWLYRLASELHSEFDFYFLATKVSTFLPKFQQIGLCAYLPSPRQMILFLQKHNIDILQAHNERWPIDAALAAGVPHIIERLGGQRSWRRVPKYGLEFVIASAQMAEEAIKDIFPPQQIQVVYNGVDLVEVDSTPKNRLFPSETVILGRVSRFGRGQNLSMLIQALERLYVKWPNLRLALIGGDSLMPGAEPIEAELRQQVKGSGLAKFVQFTGMVENSLTYTHGFDIATCVSNDEGIPNSLIEAMACRKPVISTRVGAIPEMVEDGKSGLLIPPGDIDALCAAIERLINDPAEREQMGMAGRRIIEEKFTLQRAAAQYAAIYHRILRGE